MHFIAKWPMFFQIFDPRSADQVERLASRFAESVALHLSKTGFNREEYRELVDDVIEPFAYTSGLDKWKGSAFKPKLFLVSYSASVFTGRLMKYDMCSLGQSF
jgi:hypothetical protein